MKKSHIALFSAIGFILVCVLAGLVFGRSLLGNGREWADNPSSSSSSSSRSRSINSAGSGDYIEAELSLEGFDTVVIEGFWDLQVKQGDEYSVEISYPPSWPKGDFVKQSGESLVLEYPNVKDPDEAASAWVTMPELDELRIEGFGDSDFSGFDSESLELVIEGAGRIKGMDSTIRNVRILVQGAGQVDLDDTPTVNAEVIIDGAGEASLVMDGGELSGRLDGVGRISYTGEVSSESVSIDGLGRVKYRR